MASVGANDIMIALPSPSNEDVEKVRALAVSLGGADEGAPGLRGSGAFCAYFRDLDGKKM